MIMEQKDKKRIVFKLPMLIIPGIVFFTAIGIIWKLLRLRAKAWVYIAVIAVAVVVTLIAEVIMYLVSKAWEKDDEIIEKKMAFSKWLTLELQNLEARMSAGAAKDAVHAVYDAARFSDPMSGPETEEKEVRIGELIVTLTTAIKDKDEDKIREIAEEIKLVIAERNRICKASK